MNPKTVLYVEDNFHNRRLVRKILESKGYTLVEAEDGIVGLEMIRRLRPPLVLMDIGLPGMDGITVTNMVKGEDDLRHIPIIAITASAMSGDRERFLAAGCDDYLSKPIQPIELLNMIDGYFANLVSATE
jgi:two-component system, cell cycle response regulator DivK